MLLIVDPNTFAESVRRHLANPTVYVSPQGSMSVATAIDDGRLLVRTRRKGSVEAMSHWLRTLGMEPLNGLVTEQDTSESAATQTWIAAVAYHSADDRPGLWVDAFPWSPTTHDVLQAALDELAAETGGSADDLDAFVRSANPNVVVLSPDDIDRFSRRHDEHTAGCPEVEPKDSAAEDSLRSSGGPPESPLATKADPSASTPR